MIIGLEVQLENEDELPFVYLGRSDNFNGVDTEQRRFHIMISCENYIDSLLHVHSWDTAPSKPFPWATKISSPPPDNAVNKVFKENGSNEGTTAAYALKLKV